jgi:chaperonin GroES
MTQSKIKPINSQILCIQKTAEEKSSGGIYIAPTIQKKPQEAEVIAVSEGWYTSDGKRIALDVNIGDKIFFRNGAGSTITVDSVEYLILLQSDILAVYT